MMLDIIYQQLLTEQDFVLKSSFTNDFDGTVKHVYESDSFKMVIICYNLKVIELSLSKQEAFPRGANPLVTSPPKG